MKCGGCKQSLQALDVLQYIEGSIFQAYRCRCHVWLFLWCKSPEILNLKPESYLVHLLTDSKKKNQA